MPGARLPSMAWAVLVISGLLEAVWAVALAASDGFRKLRPSIVFVVFQVITLIGLAYAMQTLPTGTSYAVWVGCGAFATLVYSIARKQERLSVGKAVLLLILVGSVVGLQVVS